MVEAATTLVLWVGTAFLLIASIAALRMPDVYCRLSASTKAVTFGASAMFIAAAVFHAGSAPMLRAIAGIVFFFATSPIAAHVVARAAFLRGTPQWAGSVVNEFPASVGLEHARADGDAGSGVPPPD